MPLHSCLIGLDQLIQAALAEVLGERVLIIPFLQDHQSVQCGLMVTIDMRRGIDGPEFACFLFFLSFSFGLVFFFSYYRFFFCFFILLTKIFRFINFLLYCLILQFSRSPSPPEVLRDLRISSYWDTQREPLRSTGIYSFFVSDEPEKNTNKGEGNGEPRDRGKREIEILKKNYGCALSFYIGYFGDIFDRKT